MPVAVALTSDYLPERLGAPMVMVIFTGNPMGGFLGGQLVAQLLPHYGWPVIFWIGGLLPLVLIPVMLFWLPESPRFLLARGRMTPSTERLMRTLNIESTWQPRTWSMSAGAIRSPDCFATAWRRPPCWSGFCISPIC